MGLCARAYGERGCLFGRGGTAACGEAEGRGRWCTGPEGKVRRRIHKCSVGAGACGASDAVQ